MSPTESGQIGKRSDQFNIRLPDGLRERIKLRAASSRRSMNAEIITILEAHMEETKTADELETQSAV